MGWYARTVQWFENHRFAVDAVGAALLAVVAAPTSADLADPFMSGGRAETAWSLALIVPLAWRRVRPVASAAAVFAVALAHMLAGYPLLVPADLAVLVALYSVTVYGTRRAHIIAMWSAAAGCLTFAVLTALHSGGLGNPLEIVQIIPISIFLGSIALAVWAFGLTRRYRRVTVETLHDRAERLQVERDQQAQIATAAERARIAREMHDIVAHSLSIVVAQADGGRYAAAQDPAAAERSLTVISETGRAALADMRRLLGVLREDPAADREASGTRATDSSTATTSPGPTGSAAPLAPQPSDADLETLVAQARDAGTRVSLVRVGSARRLPPGAGATLHRVTQEALSNVRKHAGPDPRVTVVERWDTESVTLEVSDDGRGAAAGTGEPGYGLLGMRERAAMFGGTVTAGPRPGGGWRVRFTMPVPGPSAVAQAVPTPHQEAP